MANRKVWVQAAVDAADYSIGQRIASMASQAGAEWVEVGHLLLMKYGFDAIRKIREAVDPKTKIVADYKTEMCGHFMEEIAKAGADYVIVEAAHADFLIRDALDAGKSYHITPIFFVNVRCDQFLERAREVADMGAEYLFLHRYYTGVVEGRTLKFDYIADAKRETGCMIGVSSDIYEEAMSAIDEGADWITFGQVLRQPKEESCRQWIDGIHKHLK